MELELRNRDEKETGFGGFRVTERDLDVFGFLLDQKFATLEQVYFYRFDARKDAAQDLPNKFFVTRQRLQKLVRNGFLKTERVYTHAKNLYLLTDFGYQVFKSKRPLAAYAPPVKQMDFRSFEHDLKVNDCRIAIERTGKVMKWIGERRVRLQGFESAYSWSDLPKEIVPDGIFVSSKGERIAFEIETTPRKKSRYEAKRSAYERVMIGQSALFHRVFWVGSTERIYAELKEVCQARKNFFVESYGHFLSKLDASPKPTVESLNE